VEAGGERLNTGHTGETQSREALEAVARRLFWWLSPAQALANPLRFAAQVMTYGNWEDVQISVAILGEDVFRQALANPPAGVFDGRSWSFWHVRFGIKPVPPIPTRKLK